MSSQRLGGRSPNRTPSIALLPPNEDWPVPCSPQTQPPLAVQRHHLLSNARRKTPPPRRKIRELGSLPHVRREGGRGVGLRASVRTTPSGAVDEPQEAPSARSQQPLQRRPRAVGSEPILAARPSRPRSEGRTRAGRRRVPGALVVGPISAGHLLYRMLPHPGVGSLQGVSDNRLDSGQRL